MSQHKRIILVSAMGTSPAVLTNMVWGLAHQKHSIVPDEIVVFITRSGKELLIQRLFDDGVWDEMRSNLKREKNRYNSSATIAKAEKGQAKL